ncbi:MAG: sulfotransferase [Burkholderiales bacterium]|nr:sulfotransferase [Burkholderiales bacterium]MDE2157530.1 sulfotransferase [Burkholderiales bacterium]
MAQAADPQALIDAAALHQRAGRAAEAAACYEQLLRLRPDLPNSWFNLARLQRALGRYDAALASYRQALERGIDGPEEVHLNRGVIYAEDLHQDGAALAEIEAALAIDPRYAPALLNLANLHEDRGRRDAALRAYERLLALGAGAPHHYEALARYASLHGAGSADDAIVRRLRAALDDARADHAARASLAFALAQLLDGCGAWDEAYAAAAAANAHSRATLAGPPYDRAAQERHVDALIAAFPARTAAPAPARAGEAPIFICGMFRSGSTLVEQMLAAHPDVEAGGEIAFLPELVRTRLAPFPARLAQWTPPRLAAVAAEYLALLARRHPGARRVTDKRPDNFLLIGLIKTLFPDARIVHTTRHPLDNALSVYFLHLDPSMGYALALDDIGHYYGQYRRLMAHWKSNYGDDIADIDYDRLVRDPRPETGRLLEFLGLPWCEDCLHFERVANDVRTASVWQVRQPLYTRSSGRWRHYARQLEPLREALGDQAP